MDNATPELYRLLVIGDYRSPGVVSLFMEVERVFHGADELGAKSWETPFPKLPGLESPFERPPHRLVADAFYDFELDELVWETRCPVPLLERPARYDYEYERKGTANLFVVIEPLGAWRRVDRNRPPHKTGLCS